MAKKKIEIVKEGRTELITSLLKKINEAYNQEKLSENVFLAKFLGYEDDTAKIANLKRGQIHTSKSFDKLLDSLFLALRKHAIKNTYLPIVELVPVVSRESSHGKAYEMEIGFNPKEVKDVETKIKKLKGGVYVFYDSLGKAIYVGKTEESKNNTLWDEMKSAYNRERPSQIIYKKIGKRIQKRSYFLYEVAHYVTIYQVDKYAIRDFESLLIRTFPNDLTNVRMETKDDSSII